LIWLVAITNLLHEYFLLSKFENQTLQKFRCVMKKGKQISRRNFVKTTGLAALGSTMAGGLMAPAIAQASTTEKKDAGGPYNILMIVTDQERLMRKEELPPGFSLPGHDRLEKLGVTFDNHQIGSNVCTPSRAVIYTGQHTQNNGMFDNTNFPWAGDLSTEIDTIGDLLRKQNYYTAYKGKWHLTEKFETANKLHAPKEIGRAHV
jgi:arylsulfatase